MATKFYETHFPKPTKKAMKPGTLCLATLVSFSALWRPLFAQNGYIYVHKKTLDEASSLDFAFNVSGRVTTVPAFNLNDKPDNIALLDIGSSSTGTLWATANVGGALYYRKAGTTNWVATKVASGALRVDGGLGETAYHTTSTGVYLFDGTTSTSTLIYSGATLDIGSGWNNTPYLINDSGNVLKYSGAGTTWTAFYSVNTTTNLDVDPASGNVYDTNTANTNVYQLTPAAVATAIGIPTSSITNASCSAPGSLTITVPLGASYEYSINSTTYQSSPTFTNLSGGTYTVYTRFVTKPLCVSTKVEQISIGLCGQVWNDADGSRTLNGSETGTNTGGTIYVNLVNSSGTVVTSTTVSASGSYSLTAPASTTGLKLVLTNTPTSNTPGTLPTGWVNTGENVGATNTAPQSSTLGQIELTTGAGAVTARNFGIEQLPTPGSGTATVANNGGTSPVTAPPSAFTNVTPSTDTAPGSVTAIHITTFPSNVTSLTINGTTYTAVDNAGKESTTTGTATLTPAGPPDLAPIIYALPATQYGTTTFTVVVDVYDLLTTASSGLITLYVSKDPLVNLSFNASSTLVGGRPVQNSIWTFSNTDPDVYTFTTTEVIAGKGKKSFGLTGVLTPGNTRGTLTISTTIVGGSGGEIRIDNNSDADKIDYFKK